MCRSDPLPQVTSARCVHGGDRTQPDFQRFLYLPRRRARVQRCERTAAVCGREDRTTEDADAVDDPGRLRDKVPGVVARGQCSVDAVDVERLAPDRRGAITFVTVLLPVGATKDPVAEDVKQDDSHQGRRAHGFGLVHEKPPAQAVVKGHVHEMPQPLQTFR